MSGIHRNNIARIGPRRRTFVSVIYFVSFAESKGQTLKTPGKRREFRVHFIPKSSDENRYDYNDNVHDGVSPRVAMASATAGRVRILISFFDQTCPCPLKGRKTTFSNCGRMDIQTRR